jgi:hypothetical protein
MCALKLLPLPSGALIIGKTPSRLHQQEHLIIRMVTTTVKWSDIHLDHVHTIRGGVETR